MGPQDKEMDVESLQKSGRRRGSCLDVFLVMSVAFLFVAVTTVAAGGVMALMELRAKLELCAKQQPHFEGSRMSIDTPDTVYKMQNFAYLEATSSELKTSTMHWAPVDYAAGTSVGSNFLFNTEQQSLKAERVGSYFIYMDLNLTCTFRCEAGLLTVRVGDKLTCEVELPENTMHVSKKCWTVTNLEGQRLVTRMIIPKNGLQDWKLELIGSRLGMFLVD